MPQRNHASGSPWRITGYAALVFVCVLLAFVSFLFVAAPVDLVRDRLIDEVKARTGRDLVVAGPVSMSLFPRAGVSIASVSLSEPPGQRGTLLTVDKVSAEIGLGDLLARRVQIRRLVLSAPIVTLRVDPQGRRNWDFAARDEFAPARTRYAQLRGSTMRDVPPGMPSGVDLERVREMLAQILPGELSVQRGTVSYRDARTGDALDVGDIDFEVAAASLTEPVLAKGRFSLRGQPMDYTVRLASLDAALAARRAAVVAKAQGAPFAAEFDGTIALRGPTPEVDGSLKFTSASIPALGLWLGRPIAMSGPTDASFAGRVEVAGGRVSFDTFESVLAGRPANGSLTLDFNPGRPKLTGQLQMASLDIGSLILRNAADASPTPPAGPAKADPVGDIVRQRQAPERQPQVRGFTRRDGAARDWSDDRLDTRLLGIIDAELRIAAGEILHHDLKTGPSRVALTLVDRNLRVDLEDLALYGGRGRGVATVDAAAAVPAMSLNLNLDGIAAGPFLKDAAEFEWLDGRTSINVAIAGQGYSEREVVETLSGTVEIKTLNGHFSGLNLPKVIRGLEMGQIPNLQIQPAEKTPFSEFAGQFVIAKGVAQNNDLRLYTQNARITGVGTVQLPSRRLAYDLKAKVSGTGATPQQGALINFSNIELPLRVEGPWDKPVIGLKGQDQLLDSLKQIGKNLKSNDVQDTIRGLLGGNPDARQKPRELLDRLLKKE